MGSGKGKQKRVNTTTITEHNKYSPTVIKDGNTVTSFVRTNSKRRAYQLANISGFNMEGFVALNNDTNEWELRSSVIRVWEANTGNYHGLSIKPESLIEEHGKCNDGEKLVSYIELHGNAGYIYWSPLTLDTNDVSLFLVKEKNGHQVQKKLFTVPFEEFKTINNGINNLIKSAAEAFAIPQYEQNKKLKDNVKNDVNF